MNKHVKRMIAIAQNNNIPRIKGIVSRLCEHFGEKIPGGFAFPTPEVLANCKKNLPHCFM